MPRMRSNADRKKRARRITAKKRAASTDWRSVMRRSIRVQVRAWADLTHWLRTAMPSRDASAIPRCAVAFPVSR